MGSLRVDSISVGWSDSGTSTHEERSAPTLLTCLPQKGRQCEPRAGTKPPSPALPKTFGVRSTDFFNAGSPVDISTLILLFSILVGLRSPSGQDIKRHDSELVDHPIEVVEVSVNSIAP
eukprot:4516030-Amphidinium_carterae.2